jgi:hypothetical protein
MNRSVCRVLVSVADLAVLGMTATLAGALAGSAMAQAPDATDDYNDEDSKRRAPIAAD